MKKKCIRNAISYCIKTKTWKIMRLSILFFLTTMMQIWAASSYSQDARLTLKMKNSKVIDVLDEIEQKSEFYFLLNQKLVDVERKVDIQVKEQKISNILSEIFLGTDVSYQVNDRLIILTTYKDMKIFQNQQKPISGKVIDPDGNPLPGVNVIIQGTSEGTVTNLDGEYTIQVPSDNSVLLFSFVGMLSEKVEVAGQTIINVTLLPDIVSMEEIVVVGYGVQKRSDITGSVASIPVDRLADIPVTNILHAIQGSTAGLNISQGEGSPGSDATMQIRGVNSINAKTDPFIVLDGIPFFGKTNDINPRDIESIEILKDASAVAIYGTRGANGVILITTKRGKSAQGKPTVTYSGYGGVEDISHVLESMSPEAYVQKYADYLEQNGITQTQVLPNASEVENYNNGITTDWLDEATQPGVIQEHNVSITGGTENVQYYVSGGHLDQKGVVKGWQYQRTSFRSNIDTKIADFLKLGTSAFLAANNSDGGRTRWLEATAMSPYSVPYDENGNYIIYPMSPEQLFLNPLLGLTKTRYDRGLNLTGNTYLEFTPELIEGFKYRINASYAYNINRYSSYSGREANDQNGTAENNNYETKNWIVENIVSYSKDFGVHHFDFTGLYSAQETEYYESEAKSVGFVNDALTYYDLYAGSSKSLDSEGYKKSMASQMGRINYSYDSRYLLTITARRDGSSVFGSNTSKYAVFPSIALGWNIANESFLSTNDFINTLKLRLSYGKSGNEAIEVNQTSTTASAVQYPFGGSALTGVIYDKIGNADLNWETTTGLNVGVDFGIFTNRINGTIEFYKTTTEDILLERNLPSITGYDNIWVNLGKMQNVGIEVSLSTVNLVLGSFRWDTDINFSTYKNEILELYGDGKDDIGNSWFIGQPLRVIYDFEKLGIWQEDEDPSGSDPIAIPGDIKFKDQLTIDSNSDGIADEADGSITSEDKVVIGQKDPNWTGGITNTFSYKNFSLRVFLQMSHGGLKSNRNLTYADEAWRRNLPADFKYWTPENKDNYWPSLAAYTNYRGYQFAEDYSYVRIKDITLSYVVPKDFLNKYKISGLTIYASGRNLYTFTDWFGWDPEIISYSRGHSNSDDTVNWEDNYPLVRTISFGVNLTL